MKKILLLTLVSLSSGSVVCASHESEEDMIARAIALSLGKQPEGRNNGLSAQIQLDAAYAQRLANEYADAAFARSLQQENGGKGSDRKSGKNLDQQTDDLIAALLLEDGQGGHAYAGPGFTGFHDCPTVQNVLWHSAVTTQRAVLTPIVAQLKTIAQGADVHVLDGHVAGNMAVLHAMGDVFRVDNPEFTVADMRAYLLANSSFYRGYEGQAVSQDQLTGYIDAALGTANSDASVLRMYSRVVSLIQRLTTEGVDTTTYLQLLFDAFSENYLTQGGCFQGVRNRIFVRYAAMMNSLMGG